MQIGVSMVPVEAVIRNVIVQQRNGLMNLCLNRVKFEYVIDSGLCVLCLCVALMRAGEGNTLCIGKMAFCCPIQLTVGCNHY